MEWSGWAPACLAGAERVVFLVLDGLGWNQLQARSATAPTLHGGVGRSITSVAPSTTVVALTSISTGLSPAQHGIVGYRMCLDGGVFNVLKWTIEGREARRELPAWQAQPHPVLTQTGSPDTVVVTKAELTTTGFTAAHLAPVRLRGRSTPAGLPVEVDRALAGGSVRLCLLRRCGSGGAPPRTGRALRRRVAGDGSPVGRPVDSRPPGVALAVTADHGQVDVGPRIEVLDGELMRLVTGLSGEGRFRWLHTRPGVVDETAAAAVSLMALTPG